MTVTATGMATNRVLAKLKELAEFFAGLREDGLIVVVVCLIIWFGGVPNPINHI